ncbi:hypothetical protein San01_50390 [Streptomyces angustmyceticus]|uniref:DUF317 domain-containing protein n=1 Tax=Streptomyces angustmyceticus TaxID=285578 RepID=A0A5J4LKL7_9ACTN|nr:hypothetical protein San01_50390 [Streptomyces angustmyceticus]
MTEWNAHFTAGVPHEALADLLLALDAHQAPDTGFEGAEAVLTALTARGWLRDLDRPRTTATDPRLLCQRLLGDAAVARPRRRPAR